MSKFEVFAHWDAEAGVWVAHSEDIPGLATEAETWDGLKAKLSEMGSELIALNNVKLDADGGQIHIITEDTVSVAA